MMAASKLHKTGIKTDGDQLYTETAYLGSILLGGKIADGIKPYMFRYSANQIIFTALWNLQNVCVPDIRILANHLSDTGELGKVGGAAYIAELTNGCSLCNIGYYASDLSESYYILEDEILAPVSAALIAEKAEKSTANTINILKRLLALGIVNKLDRGLWTLSNSLVNDP